MAKRKLTASQIEELLECIQPNPYIPEETALVVVKTTRDSLRNQLLKVEIYPKLFQTFKKKIAAMYASTLIQPGECVGIVTAQSIGEKQTQSNLNSLDWTEKVLLLVEGEAVVMEIGRFIDKLLTEASPETIQYYPENRTEYLDTNNLVLQIPSCDSKGKTSWLRVEAVTRHLPVGKLVRVVTESGRSVTATQAKSFLVWNGSEFADTNGSDLKVGDLLPTTQSLPFPATNETYLGFPLTSSLGRRVALHLTGKKRCQELEPLCGTEREIPAFCYTSNLRFLTGLLSRLSTDIPGVPFLHTLVNNSGKGVFLDRIKRIDYIESSTEFVYDFTVEKTRNFQIWNGLNVRDTFHKAGSSDKQPVVSKFSELLNTTTKPKAPSYLVYFSKGNKSVGELRQTIGHSIVQLTFKRITKRFSVCLDKVPEPWYDTFRILYGAPERTFTDCISLQVDMDLLYEYRLRLSDIARVISEQYSDLYCIFSPDCYGQIDVYLDTRNVELPEEKLVFVTKENSREIYLEEVVQPILEGIILCGIPGVMNMFFLQDKGEWFIDTENTREKITETVRFRNKTGDKERLNDGTKRFKKVLSHPAVDTSRTVSNNVWDIYHTFGIEAVRQYMIEEFSSIMEGINLCHVMLLVDKMTFTGTISSISRYTMRREESGPFGKASFEETLDNFLKAGVFGQEEPTRGVSASIICGKRAPIGTGLCELAMDIKKLK